MSSNVINLFDERKKVLKSEEENTEEGKEDFRDIMERNKKNRERMEQDRKKANQSTLRSYKIK